MIYTDGTPTVAHRGAVEAALAQADAREAADAPMSDECMPGCDPGDCNTCGR